MIRPLKFNLQRLLTTVHQSLSALSMLAHGMQVRLRILVLAQRVILEFGCIDIVLLLLVRASSCTASCSHAGHKRARAFVCNIVSTTQSIRSRARTHHEQLSRERRAGLLTKLHLYQVRALRRNSVGGD
jgi:hypothetical protein